MSDLFLFKFSLGDKVKDNITGFIGIIVGRTEWLNGCIRYSLQPIKLKDGAPQETQAFDEDQLELVTAKKKAVVKRTGGDRKDPKRGQTVKLSF